MASSLAAPRGDLTPASPGGGRPDADRAPAPLVLAGLGVSLDTTPIEELERIATSLGRDDVASRFREVGGSEEAALLVTCHRIELLLLVRTPAVLEAWRSRLPGPPERWTERAGLDLVHHLFRVAAGRESLAPGETEVREQVRRTAGAILSRHPTPILKELLLAGVAAAEEVGRATPAPSSIAALAARRLIEALSPSRRKVVVVGAGAIGRQVAALLATQASVTVVFHRHAPDPRFLAEHGVAAAPVADLRDVLATADGVVAAAKFSGRLVHAGDLAPERPVVVVDLGLPRNVDPGVRALPNVRLTDLEDLRRGTPPAAAEDAGDAGLRNHARRVYGRLEPRLLEPWVGALREKAELLRRAELARARPFLGNLDPAQELAVERLTRHLVDRLLATPTERLRRLPPGPAGEAERRRALALFDPAAPAP